MTLRQYDIFVYIGLLKGFPSAKANPTPEYCKAANKNIA
jgi:hypothetical protein